jgi:hypothetical protein
MRDIVKLPASLKAESNAFAQAKTTPYPPRRKARRSPVLTLGKAIV